MRGLTGLCLVCFLLLPAPGGAEEMLSVGAWWCLPLSQEAVDCRRYTPGDAPARGENVVAVGKLVADVSGLVTASGPLRLHTRYTSVIVRHGLTSENGRPRLRFALPGTPEGREQAFIVESEESAYIMRSGGSTSPFYMRMPGLDAALDAAVRAAPFALSRCEIIRGVDGVPLLRHDPRARTLTALDPRLIEYGNDAPMKIREVKEQWTEKGKGTAITLRGQKFTLVVEPDGEMLRLYDNSSWEEPRRRLLELPLDAASMAFFR